MSLIPFILDLADELQDFQSCLASDYSGMDIDDTDFGLYPLNETASQNNSQQQQQPQSQQQPQQQQQQEQQQQRRPRSLSQLSWQPSMLQKHRHSPYHHGRLYCSSKEKDGITFSDRLGAASTFVGLTNKRGIYPLVRKNGWLVVSMNVKQFTPNELNVKIVDNCIIVEGRHEDKEDVHGVISRHFIRKYFLPRGYDSNDVVSTLSSDGVLTVKAPPPIPPKTQDESIVRIVDIQQTGPTHSAAKDVKATNAESNIELSKTLDTQGEKYALSEASKQLRESSTSVGSAPVTADSDIELKTPHAVSDIEEASASSLERVERIDDDSAESTGCTGISIDIASGTVQATATATATAIATSTAAEIIAESANLIAAPAEHKGLVGLGGGSGITIAENPIDTEMNAADEKVDAATNNREKTEADIEANANTDVDTEELSYGPIKNKNGGIIVEQIPPTLDVLTNIPASQHVKELCISKGVVNEATATNTITAMTSDIDGENENENDNDNDIDTNGSAGSAGSAIETLPSASEEVAAN